MKELKNWDFSRYMRLGFAIIAGIYAISTKVYCFYSLQAFSWYKPFSTYPVAVWADAVQIPPINKKTSSH